MNGAYGYGIVEMILWKITCMHMIVSQEEGLIFSLGLAT